MFVLSSFGRADRVLLLGASRFASCGCVADDSAVFFALVTLAAPAAGAGEVDAAVQSPKSGVRLAVQVRRRRAEPRQRLGHADVEGGRGQVSGRAAGARNKWLRRRLQRKTCLVLLETTFRRPKLCAVREMALSKRLQLQLDWPSQAADADSLGLSRRPAQERDAQVFFAQLREEERNLLPQQTVYLCKRHVFKMRLLLGVSCREPNWRHQAAAQLLLVT